MGHTTASTRRELVRDRRSNLLRQASEMPVGDPERRKILSGLVKTAKFDLGETAFNVLNKLRDNYITAKDTALKKLTARLEKELLKIDLVMDRRTTHLDVDEHREGPRLDGKLAFIDKRSHVRSRDELREDLEQVGLYLASLTQGRAGVWSLYIGS